jgi:6-phosphogluconolactonase (cycloisomerase 2 family)
LPIAFLLAAAAGAAGCGSEAWFGDGPGAEAAVTTPAGVQTGNVTLAYTLTGDMTETDVTVSFSTDGTSFREASAGPGGDGTRDLTVSPAGEAHVFVWASGDDLDGAREDSVILRVHPEGGVSDATAALTVHNSRFACGVEDRDDGHVRLYRLDAVDGDLQFLESDDTGGTDPQGIAFHGEFFFIAHRSSDDVAVFQLDEEEETLTAAPGSPFAGDGAGAGQVATDGKFVFVANQIGGTLTVFDLDAETGALTLNPHSGMPAAGARGLVVWQDHVYVASESGGSILIFDIASDGELVANAASPLATGGLASPRAVTLAGTRLYAANAASASLCGFNLQGGGGASVIAGSPFAISATGVEALARNGTKLFASSTVGPSFLALTIDAFGAVTEDAVSPFALSGPSTTAASAGAVALAPTTTSEEFVLWSIDPAGVVAPHPSSPIDSGIGIRRLALTD